MEVQGMVSGKFYKFKIKGDEINDKKAIENDNNYY